MALAMCGSIMTTCPSTCAGTIWALAGGNGDVGDIEGKPELKQAYDLGKSVQ